MLFPALGLHAQTNLIYTCKSGSGVADLLLVALWMQPACLLPRPHCRMGMQISTKKCVLCSVCSQNLSHKDGEVFHRRERAASTFLFPVLWCEKDEGLLVTSTAPHNSGSLKIAQLLSRVALQSPPPQTHGNWQQVRAFDTPGCT